MIPLVSYSQLSPKVISPLPEHYLLRARNSAPHLIRELERIGLSFWLLRGLQSMITTTISLIGVLLLGWSALWIATAMAVDLCATLLTDWLKQWLAPRQVHAEMSETLETEHVLATIHAMSATRRWPGVSGPPREYRSNTKREVRSLSDSPRRYLYHGCKPGQNPHDTARDVLLQIQFLLVLPFCALLLLILSSRGMVPDAETAGLLAFGFALKLIDGMREIRAAKRQDDRPHPQLLPQTLPIASILYLTVLAYGFLAWMALPSLDHLGDEVLGPLMGALFLAVHLLTTAGTILVWRSHYRRQLAALRTFASTDPDTLRARWYMFNGEDPGLLIANADSAGKTPERGATP